MANRVFHQVRGSGSRFIKARRVIQAFGSIRKSGREIGSWTFPLHFIDFETSMAPYRSTKADGPMKASPSSSPTIQFSVMGITHKLEST